MPFDNSLCNPSCPDPESTCVQSHRVDTWARYSLDSSIFRRPTNTLTAASKERNTSLTRRTRCRLQRYKALLFAYSGYASLQAGSDAPSTLHPIYHHQLVSFDRPRTSSSFDSPTRAARFFSTPRHRLRVGEPRPTLISRNATTLSFCHCI
ncbi:hypothetical protein K505DRAFT_142054 [Melanomma pulvis-pyrius CBS 109.77]|uniref:Uncharacterized protein n=1 Tax=Melanomma pulvis-pyrius CBS 109.77 TaxID=1314802 RepID=A0A6A6XY39_9PLEO|nr:hypothetical protein K505DRAFT_142054 [Melanomma pulvis-pyrius CBS 109.77]